MDAIWSALMFIGSSLCHQIPERSYFWGDLQMPLCARCIGIHFGFLVSTAVLVIAGRRFALELPSLRRLAVLGAIMSFFFVDAALSYSGISESDNLRRTLSGLSLGVPLAFFAFLMLSNFPTSMKIRPTHMPDGIFFAALALAFVTGSALVLSSESARIVFLSVSVAGLVGMVLLYSSLIFLGLSIYTDGAGRSRRTLALASISIAALTLAIFAVARELLSS